MKLLPDGFLEANGGKLAPVALKKLLLHRGSAGRYPALAEGVPANVLQERLGFGLTLCWASPRAGRFSPKRPKRKTNGT